MKIILLNGAPRSGKDTISRMIKQSSPSHVHEEKFAQPIKLCVPLAFNIPRHEWEEHYDTPEYKDIPCDAFMGKSPREAQISFSEGWLKPSFGKYIFGELLLRRLQTMEQRGYDACVISDSGFSDEAEILVNAYGAESVSLWRITREGCTFANDSRGYIDLRPLGVEMFHIENNCTYHQLKVLVQSLYSAVIISREFTLDPNTGKRNELETEGQFAERRNELIARVFSQHRQDLKEYES